MQQFHLNHGKVMDMVQQVKQNTDPDEVIALLRRIDFYINENIRIMKGLQ